MKVDLIDWMGSDLTVVNAARVSFNKESEYVQTQEEGGRLLHYSLSEKDKKLIEYLAKHGHWTPFAHPQITLRVKVPIFVRTQLFKHKVGFTENEVSRRYVDDEPEFYFPILRQRPDDGAKQGSKDEFPVNLELCEAVVSSAHNIALKAYKMLIDENVAPEQARMILPQSMYTEFYWTGSLAAFARMCKQRLDPHAQGETREIAKKISETIEPLFPVSWRVLLDK